MRYNLIDEKWIRCLLAEGNVESMSIRDVLSRSKDIIEIIDSSPLIVASLHRLLLAILERSLNLIKYDDVRRIWTNGCWDNARIDAYLDQWHNRFDLYDSQRPFYQSPGFLEGKPITINKLFNEMSATNNTVLFDHRFDDVDAKMEASMVARGLVAAQAFALGGGKSATINLLHAPLVGKAVVLLRGNNLFETLSLNLLPMRNYCPTTLTGEATDEQLSLDRPIWEAESLDKPGVTRPILGYLDLLTWQPRAINLLPDDDSSETFSWMHMAQGTVGKNDILFDPMVAYHQNKEYGWRPVGIDIDKEPWRNLSALIQTTEERKGTRTLNSAGNLVRDGLIPRGATYRLDVLGMCSEQAKILQWKHARIPFPASYLNNELLVSYLTDAIAITEQIERSLKAGIYELASKMLYPSSEKSPDKNVVKQMVDSFQAVPRYWSVLEIPFYSLIEELNESVSKNLERENKIMLRWAELVVKMAADDALNDQIGSMGDEARALKAAVMARRKYVMSLAETMKGIRGKYFE